MFGGEFANARLARPCVRVLSMLYLRSVSGPTYSQPAKNELTDAFSNVMKHRLPLLKSNIIVILMLDMKQTSLDVDSPDQQPLRLWALCIASIGNVTCNVYYGIASPPFCMDRHRAHSNRDAGTGSNPFGSPF